MLLSIAGLGQGVIIKTHYSLGLMGPACCTKPCMMSACETRQTRPALVLLDLSAAFDTVDHNILLRRLEHTYQLGGVVLEWFRSYLVGRRQHMRTSSSTSAPAFITCGVPQGSVLGPILFLLYTADLLSLIERHGFIPHLYADDTQMW